MIINTIFVIFVEILISYRPSKNSLKTALCFWLFLSKFSLYRFIEICFRYAYLTHYIQFNRNCRQKTANKFFACSNNGYFHIRFLTKCSGTKTLTMFRSLKLIFTFKMQFLEILKILHAKKQLGNYMNYLSFSTAQHR